MDLGAEEGNAGGATAAGHDDALSEPRHALACEAVLPPDANDEQGGPSSPAPDGKNEWRIQRNAAKKQRRVSVRCLAPLHAHRTRTQVSIPVCTA